MTPRHSNSMRLLLTCLAALLFATGFDPPCAQAQQSHATHKEFLEYKTKAEKGDAPAQYNLGLCYERGEGVEKDYAEALKWYRKAAEQNLAAAQNNLGLCYDDGKGVERDYAEAVKWYRKAAEQNSAEAQTNLGSRYECGQGVEKDYTEAAQWYRKAAEQDYTVAQYSLGYCYRNGKGVERSYAEATKWYRKAAEQNHAEAQNNLGLCYDAGEGVEKDSAEAVKWYRKAAEQNLSQAQYNLGICYDTGKGVDKDYAQAVKWYRKAAEQGDDQAQNSLGVCYYLGKGVEKDSVEAVKWYRKAAEQNDDTAQYNLGLCYANGDGVTKDYVEAHQWFNLASAQGHEAAKRILVNIETLMTTEQMAEAQRLARQFKPRKALEPGASGSPERIADSRPSGSGTGFFITEDGYLITNEHVIRTAAQVRLVSSSGIVAAKVVKVDAANDLALLKADGRFTVLPVVASRTVRLGNTVATVGFPNVGLQGFAPKLAKGEIAALSGALDDSRYFQISVPVQPGNSGGALVDEHGNVVGIVSAKLNAAAALATSGTLPENVNYAVKSSFLLGFLESVPEVLAKLQEPNRKERKFEDVVRSAEQATVLVLVY